MKIHSINRFAHQAAFTLVEIMVVMGIIAVLAGLAINKIVGNVEAAKLQRADADITTISTQLKTYEMLNLFYPTSQQGLQALVTRPTAEPVPRRWQQLLQEVPMDPWGRLYQYRYPGAKNPSSFDLYSQGPNPEDPSDDIGNWK
ncbi:MAG: type II secretion system major pseudopilin GspG [Verrucomicrobiae bacterium]|nr:type II secretion system major pseudopilin GspG [Verrucomicrobiae bacterium]